MYTGYGFHEFEIGDIDVIKVGDTFHLFHLVLPNHDYIAHAVSKDGLNWRRVKNALFIGHPGEWDDDMLWTMQVSENPHRPGSWRMFYTGLSRHERGRIQRVGVAHSDDLIHWHKDTSGRYPLELNSAPYEHRLDQGRKWVSFRDPYYLRKDGEGYLLVSGRVDEGPIIRRGCVVLAQETAPDQFEFLPPLFHPHRYDDVEVPVVNELSGRYYLLGSIREDIKVHYWYADEFRGPYLNFSDNVLLPQGNYAARTCQDGERTLVWNFFFKGLTIRGHHLLPPPKELVVKADGQLALKSFYGFDEQVLRHHTMDALTPLRALHSTAGAATQVEGKVCHFGSDCGFEAFLLAGNYDNFRLRGMLDVEGRGKCGFVMRLDDKGDGYYVSLDPFKGIAQLRAWSTTPEAYFEDAFSYEQLQAGHYEAVPDTLSFELLAFGKYLEFSLNGNVLLTLADERFERGSVGFYAESARLCVSQLELDELAKPKGEDYAEVV